MMIRIAFSVAALLAATAGISNAQTALNISPCGTLPTAYQGSPINYSVQLAVTNGLANKTYTWSAVSTGTNPLPAGITLSPAGLLSGTPTQAGSYAPFIFVVDNANDAGNCEESLTVVPAPTITVTSTTNGACPNTQAGAQYSCTLVATNGSGSYTWGSVNGLPPGLVSTPSGSTLSITGTVSTSAPLQIYSIAVSLSDSNGTKDQNSPQYFYVTVNPPTGFGTPPGALPGAEIGFAYKQSIVASGFPPFTYGWTPVSSSQTPPGLTLNAQTGSITGTPTGTCGSSAAPVACQFNVTVTDSGTPPATINQNFSLQIQPALSIAGPSPVPTASAGGFYAIPITISGGWSPYQTSPPSCTPPLQFSFTGGNGVYTLSGTPPAITSQGTYTCTVSVQDSIGQVKSATVAIPVTVQACGFNVTSLPPGEVNVPYSSTLQANSNCTAPVAFSISKGSAPTGLSLNGAVLGGTPNTAGPVTFTVTLTDSSPTKQTPTQTFTVTIAPPVQVTPCASIPAAITGASFTCTFTSSGGNAPYTYSATGLPAGLSMNPSTGVVSGTVSGTATVGSVPVTVKVTDASNLPPGGANTVTITITVESPLSCTIPPLRGQTGSAFSANLATYCTGGTPPYTFVSVSSPATNNQFTLNGSTLLWPSGALCGSFAFTVTVKDAAGAVITATSAAVVNPMFPATTGQTNTPGTNPTIVLTLVDRCPVALNATIHIQFTPNAVNGGTDSTIQFPSGSNWSFTIPATAPITTQYTQALSTGTEAGKIALTVSSLKDAAGNDYTPVNPNLLPNPTVTIPQEAPQITSFSATRSGAGALNVTISGYSTTREMTSAVFSFTSNNSTNIASVTIPNFQTLSNNWYQSTAAASTGGLFAYTQPFTLTAGSSANVSSVSVTLTNSVGTASQSATVTGQ